jgi:hypothetical protein
MAIAKKNTSASHRSPLGQAVRLLLGPGRPLVVVAAVIALLFGGWYVVWVKVRGHLLSSAEYLVGPQQVDITPLPPWIHTDIRPEVFRNASLDGPLSIMDDDLTERIASAFSLHPWIAKVVRVTKHHPARVTVDLLYRQPVCMVDAPGNLLPVDAHGVLLPEGEFSSVEKSRFPRLVRIDTLPVGTAGENWGDPRVVGGAEIAAQLLPVWDSMGLLQIIPSDPLASEATDETTYTLVTRAGTRILWGQAPGANPPGELSAVEKMARLQQYFDEHGTLDVRDAPRQLDINHLRISARPNQ